MNHDYLKKEKSPKILVEAMKFLGLKEIEGKQNSETIMGWAKELGLSSVYTSDEVAWCGLFMAHVCHNAGVETNLTPRETLWALNWNKFGTAQKEAMLGDILTFSRNSGGHVGIYVGEDEKCFHVLGGNQSNSVCVTRIEKTRISKIRRTSWKVSQPESVRKIMVSDSGEISHDEA